MAEHLKNLLSFVPVKRLVFLNIGKCLLKIDFEDRVWVDFNFEGIDRAHQVLFVEQTSTGIFE